MKKYPLISLLLPVRNEVEMIERCLTAIAAQDYPGKMEIIIAEGESTDGTRAILEAFAHKNPACIVLDNPEKITPTALNRAIRQARGEILLRVDGHCEIAPDYARRCVEHLLSDNVDGAGGSTQTIGKTALAQVIALAMSSPFGVGNVAFRTTFSQTRLTDTVPFAAYRRETMQKMGLYDEELVRNQDDEYNFRIRSRGGRILLAEDIHSTYFSRATLTRLWQQYFQYGFYKVRVLQKHPRQMSLRQFVPPIFVLSLLFSFVLFLSSFIFYPSSFILYLSFFIPLLYILANLFASAVTAAKKEIILRPSAFLLPLVFAILHFSYGLGFLAGLFKFWNRWGDRSGKTPAWENIYEP